MQNVIKTTVSNRYVTATWQTGTIKHKVRFGNDNQNWEGQHSHAAEQILSQVDTESVYTIIGRGYLGDGTATAVHVVARR